MRYFLVLLVLVLVGCGLQEENNRGDFKTIKIKSARVKFDIPAAYEKYTKGQDLELDSRIQLYYKQFEGSQHKPVVFVDSNDVRNTIILFPWDKHINLTNKVAGIYLGLLNRQFKESIIGLATNSKLIEKKNYDGQAQLIKVKYELELENQVQNSTNYLISVGDKTFAIYHNTYNLGEDLESNLLKLKKY